MRIPLYAISRRVALGDLSFEDWLSSLTGVGAVQLREKDLEDGELLDLTRLARRILPRTTRLLVNGRADIALAGGADGVHLSSRGVPVAAVRSSFGSEFLIGISAHEPQEIADAARDGADYALYGPIYETPGKGPPKGPGALAEVMAAGIPLYALGGVTIDAFDELASAGATGAAGIRMFLDPTTTGSAVSAAAISFR